MKAVCLTVLLMILTIQQQLEKGKAIEVAPTALQTMSHSFSQVLTYFYDSQETLDLQLLQQVASKINSTFSQDKTLVAYVNISDDHFNKLGVSEIGYRLIKRQQNLVLGKNLSQGQIIQFYSTHVHPKLPILYQSQLKSKSQYTLGFFFSETKELQHHNKVYELVHQSLRDFGVKAFGIVAEDNSNQDSSNNKVDSWKNTKKVPNIHLFYNGSLKQTYGIANMSFEELEAHLIYRVNLDSLELLTELNNQSLYRVFGRDIQNQLILLYQPKNKHSQEINLIRHQFKQAAKINIDEHLYSHRVVFSQANTDFFLQNFNEQASQILKSQKGSQDKLLLPYRIILIKADFSTFQLQKFFFPQSQEPSAQNLIQFIQDIKLKKIDPEFKSEPIPTQKQNSEKILRKIVGKSFIREIFQNSAEQSVLVLFIDSKDPQSCNQIKVVFQDFVRTYKNQMKSHVISGVFDLAKNEHKMLKIREAPQLLLFEKSNKKHTKVYKQISRPSVESIKEWLNSQLTHARIADKQPMLQL